MGADAKAKKILRKKWPGATQDIWDVPTRKHFWLRAQPVEAKSQTAPRLSVPGSPLFKYQPDGLWVLLTKTHADVVAIEVCGSRQNFEQRRSKYAPDTRADRLMLGELVEGQRSIQEGQSRAVATLGLNRERSDQGPCSPGATRSGPLRISRHGLPEMECEHCAGRP